MKATEFIKASLENWTGPLIGMASDMKDSSLTQPTPNGGNHPAWVLGHITHAESAFLDEFILGKPNRFPELENCKGGTEPTTNAEDYLPIDQLLEKFQQIRSATLAHLNSISDDDLDKKSHAPEKYSGPFGTVGKCYSAMIWHMSIHTGQVADARRAAGRKPLSM